MPVKKTPTWAEINKRTAALNAKLKTGPYVQPAKPATKPASKPATKPATPRAPDNFVTRRRKTYQKLTNDKIEKATNGK